MFWSNTAIKSVSCLVAGTCAFLLFLDSADAGQKARKSMRGKPAQARAMKSKRVASKKGMAKKKANRAIAKERAPKAGAKKAKARRIAQAADLPARMPADTDRTLRVQGQSRNLSMMLVLKGDKEKIQFGDIREDYRDEILGTQF